MIRTLRVGAAVLGMGMLIGAGPVLAAGAVADAPVPSPDHVVVVGVAGLRWSDVNATDTPAVAALTRSGSAGSLSIRSAPQVTCAGEGWLTLGTGAYAAVTDPAGVDPSAGCQLRLPPPVASPGAAGAGGVAGAAGGPATVPALPELRRLNAGLRFGARPGLLGERLPCATAVGPGAALALADPDGLVRHYHPALPAEPAAALARCPVTVVDLGAVTGEGEPRRRAARSFDQALARVRAGLPADAVLLVVGVAETEAGQPRLHAAVATGPGYGAGWLRSPSTGRIPYLQLVDVAPTVLATLGQEVPDHLAGRPLSGGAAGRPGDLGSILARLVDTDTQAVAQRAVLGTMAGGLAVALSLVVGAAVWLLRRCYRTGPVAWRDRTGPWSRWAAGWLSVAALGLSAVPAATFVANVVPWWRSPSPLLALAGAVAVTAVGMVTTAVLAGRRVGDWQARVKVRLGVLAAMTLLVFFLDGLTGASLQLSSLLGYNPLVAGRFTGLGNIAFAVYAVAGVLLATVLAHGHRPATAVAAVAVVAVPVVAFDGLPWWGADFGGVLTLVPTFVVLGLLVANARVTWRRLVVAGAAGVALVLVISWLDYLRPAPDRSHFGRFLISMVDGSASQVIRRKLLANLELLVIGPHSVVAALLVIVGVMLLVRPPPALRRVYEIWPVVRAGLVAMLVLAGFGFATNDSGVAIPSVMSLVILPTVVALCLWVVFGDPWQHPPPRAVDAGRVEAPTG